MDHLLTVLEKEGFRIDGNVAVDEPGIKVLLERHGVEVNLEELAMKKVLRRIKTNDNCIYYMIQPQVNKSNTKRMAEDEEANNLKESNNELDSLEKENKSLQEALGTVDHTKMYNEYIELLHDYNELKDVVQAMLGRLAVMRNMTTRELYPEFDLDPKD